MMHRFILLLFLISLLSLLGTAQSTPEKISTKDYIEANDLARKFFARYLQTKDIRPLIAEFGTSDFKECISMSDFAFVHEKQLSKISEKMKYRYYVAETNFMFLLTLWSSSQPSLPKGENYFDGLPPLVKRAITQKVYTDILKNDSYAMSNGSGYFHSVLNAFERANPIFIEQIQQAGKRGTVTAHKRFANMESGDFTNADSLFRPELISEPKDCGSTGNSSSRIIVDIPFFQLNLVNVNGKLRMFRFPFHID